MSEPGLNQRAQALCADLSDRSASLGIDHTVTDEGTTLWDFGVASPGSIEAGLLLARVCMADAATVEVDAGDLWPRIEVATSEPVAACMASQYAGWEVKGDGFFAMGSGPMRAAAAREPLFKDIGGGEQAELCVGVLESSRMPPPAVCRDIAEKCGVDADRLTLLVARTSSLAGTVQVVARSVETAMHKLHELGFDLQRVSRGEGTAPLPPVAENDLAAIGVTNDAVLYGGSVTLEVCGDDPSLAAIVERVPSSASPDHGRPFAEVLAAAGNDFYQIDPMLFSPAEVVFRNRDTGSVFQAGGVDETVLRESFGTAAGAS